MLEIIRFSGYETWPTRVRYQEALLTFVIARARFRSFTGVAKKVCAMPKMSEQEAGLNTADARSKLVKEILAKERAASDAKTARLRELRLAHAASIAPPLFEKRKVKKSGKTFRSSPRKVKLEGA